MKIKRSERRATSEVSALDRLLDSLSLLPPFENIHAPPNKYSLSLPPFWRMSALPPPVTPLHRRRRRSLTPTSSLSAAMPAGGSFRVERRYSAFPCISSLWLSRHLYGSTRPFCLPSVRLQLLISFFFLRLDRKKISVTNQCFVYPSDTVVLVLSYVASIEFWSKLWFVASKKFARELRCCFLVLCCVRRSEAKEEKKKARRGTERVLCTRFTLMPGDNKKLSWISCYSIVSPRR